MSNLTVIEHKGIRVLTTAQLAKAYETDANNIQKNFSNNRDRFEEGRDYYMLQGEELIECKRVLNNIQEPMKFVSQLILWTERGANRHSKILDTDKAWQQFDLLEETYFNTKNAPLPQMTQWEVIAKMAQFNVEQEQRVLALETRSDKMERRLELVKDTFAKPVEDNWRKTINASLTKIVESSELGHQTIRTISYDLLEERARCRLNAKVTNARGRLAEAGATKTKIDACCKLDVIEQDTRLKEIYTNIVRELVMRYVA